MPLLKINAEGPFLPPETRVRLRQALDATPKGAPVVICIHGYKFSPQIAAHDPHDHILALDPGLNSRKVLSWPRALGFGTGTAQEGLCIALGWEARGTIWQAYDMARQTGEALARLIWKMDRPVQLIGHSLGARVILSALPRLPADTVQRAILLAGAEFRSAALHALESEAGRTVEILNVTSRENRIYDLMVEMALRPDHGASRTLGAGLGELRRNWCDLAIDKAQARATLARLGYAVPAPDRRVCHWSPYLREGLFDLYRVALRVPERLPLALLQETLQPVPSLAPPRSRWRAQESVASPLSFSRKASS
jgi:pimeloyl-ACP methyl ester carboxylesterase